MPLGFDFIHYKNGPFSFDLRDELTSLRADDLLTLQPQAIPYGPRLAPTPNAAALATRFPKTVAKYSHAVAFIAERLGGRGVNGLESLATAVYVTRKQPGEGPEGRAAALVELKPHIPSEDALAAVREADALLAEAAPATECSAA